MNDLRNKLIAKYQKRPKTSKYNLLHYDIKVLKQNAIDMVAKNIKNGIEERYYNEFEPDFEQQNLEFNNLTYMAKTSLY